jgi:purine-binding chemotaxis protein CheW
MSASLTATAGTVLSAVPQVTLCAFRLSDVMIGVEVDAVFEVLDCPDVTPVPLAPAEIHGLINLRGQILTVIDVRRRLGATDVPAEPAHMIVVVRTSADPVALLVDQVLDVIQVDRDSFEPAPQSLDSQTRTFVTGVHTLVDTLLLRLDIAAVVDRTTIPWTQPVSHAIDPTRPFRTEAQQ